MRLFILGLRRSGTTAFWDVFRQDGRFLAYNEPFNPLLRNAGDAAWIARYPAYREFHQLWARDPGLFWRRYRAVQGLEEIQDDLSDQQAGYLEFLLGSAEHVVFDLTRGHFKLASLAALAPDAVLVHLHRPPGSFATSHLVPSGQQIPRLGNRRETWTWLLWNFALKRLNRASFWSRRTRFDYWGLEGLIGSSPESLFGQRLREAGLDPDEVYRMPALGRLLAYWLVHHRRVEQDGARHYGDRFLSVNFDDFCQNPRDTVARVYRALGSQPPELDLSGIHPARGRYQPDNPAWERYARQLGLPGRPA
jgi:hypothetical protein